MIGKLFLSLAFLLNCNIYKAESNMNCPHCKVFFFDEWSIPSALVWNDDRIGQGIKTTECPACCRLIVKIVEGKINYISDNFEKDETGEVVIDKELTIYPVQSEAFVSDDVPDEYKKELNEAHSILDSSPKASAAISRRLLQVLLEDVLNIKGRTLSDQIDKFLELENVPSHLSKSIDAVRVIGNFAAHPSKDTNTGTVLQVEPGEAEWLVEVIQSFFDFLFIQPKRIERRRNELNIKLNKMGKPSLKG